MALGGGVLAETAPEALCDSDALYEIVGGEYLEVPRMGAYSSLLATELCICLGLFARQTKSGLVALETLFRLSPQGPSRRPDVAFAAFDRFRIMPEPADQPPEWDAVPNLAVEVISPSNKSDEVETKLVEYFQAGVQLVWVIYPRHRRIYVHESPAQVRVLLESDELVGDPALPGFKLPIRDLFAALAKPA